MADPVVAAQRPFPAPGSAVPGAPPPLRRPLTPADGVPVAARAAKASAGSDSPSAPVVAARSDAGGSARFTVAAALVGVAVGLELAGLLGRASRCRKV